MRAQIKYENQIVQAEAQVIQGKLWIHFQGRTWLAADDLRRSGKSAFSGATAGKATKGLILSQMPGKVIKIFKAVGDKVTAGEVILVMEAMKMEYTMKADIDGTLESIKCEVGRQMELGKVLATICQD